MEELNADSMGLELESLASTMSATSGMDAEGFALEEDVPPAELSEIACGFELTLTEDAWQPTHSDGIQLEDETMRGGLEQQPVGLMETDNFQSFPPFDDGGTGFQLDGEGTAFQFSSEEEASIEKDLCNQPYKPIVAAKARGSRCYLRVENPVVSKAAVDMEILLNSCRGRRGVDWVHTQTSKAKFSTSCMFFVSLTTVLSSVGTCVVCLSLPI